MPYGIHFWPFGTRITYVWGGQNFLTFGTRITYVWGGGRWWRVGGGVVGWVGGQKEKNR